jgi:hypothetical protein
MCGVTVGGVILIAVIISITILMITAIKTTPPTVTPQIRPTKNTNDYSNQDHATYCNTTNNTYKKY